MDADRRKELQDMLWKPGRWIVYGVLAAMAIWVVGAGLFGLGHRKPQTVGGVLSSAAQKDTGKYIMEYQALRRVTYDSDELVTAFHGDVQMDAPSKAYVLNMLGATVDGKPLHVDHAGAVTIYSSTSLGESWRRAPDLSVQAMTAFNPRSMQEMKPVLLRDTGSYRSSQAWVIQLKPSGDQLANILWANQLQMTGSTAEREAKDLHEGHYNLDLATAWIGYKSERILAVDLRFKIDKGAEYRIRIKYGSWGTVDLHKFKLREISNPNVTTSGGKTQAAGQ